MGENRWRDEREWPLARTNYTKVYLHSRGRANSIRGDGALSFDGPGDESADQYVYDPDDPVPTCGGTTLGLPPGVYDQTEVEQRADVLVYTSELAGEGPRSDRADFDAALCGVVGSRYGLRREAGRRAPGWLRAEYR